MGSTANINGCETSLYKPKCENLDAYGVNLKILPSNEQIRELQTILRDKYVHFPTFIPFWNEIIC